MKIGRSFLIAILGVLALASCKANNLTPIRTLLDDPSRFDHQIIRVVGTVEEAAGILGYGIYRLDDGTGTITILTQENGAPRSGAQVGVEGEFRSAFTIGAQSVAALMEKQRFTPKQ